MQEQQALPRDADGTLITSAIFGEDWVVEVEYNTDHDGRVINPELEDYPRTVHGGFYSKEEADEWAEGFCPDDTDINEVRVIPLNLVRPRPSKGTDMIYVLLTDTNDGSALIACPTPEAADSVGAAAILNDGGVSAWLVPESAVIDHEKVTEILKQGGRIGDIAAARLPEQGTARD
jgi:hypothetical protein